MSANNLIMVSEKKSQYKVAMHDADTGVQMGKAEYFKDLKDAVKRAQSICDWENVEYGIHFSLGE